MRSAHGGTQARPHRAVEFGRLLGMPVGGQHLGVQVALLRGDQVDRGGDGREQVSAVQGDAAPAPAPRVDRATMADMVLRYATQGMD